MIRDWSRRLAERLRELLASSLNPTVDDGTRFDMFLDDRSLAAGDELTGTLRGRAERSAILLVADESTLPPQTDLPR